MTTVRPVAHQQDRLYVAIVCAILLAFALLQGWLPVLRRRQRSLEGSFASGVAEESVVQSLDLVAASALSKQHHPSASEVLQSTGGPSAIVARRAVPQDVSTGPRLSRSVVYVPLNASEFILPLQDALPETYAYLDAVWPCRTPDWCGAFPLDNVSRDTCESIEVFNPGPCFNSSSASEMMCSCPQHVPVAIGDVFLHVASLTRKQTSFAAMTRLLCGRAEATSSGYAHSTEATSWEERLVAVGTANAAFHYLRCQGNARMTPPHVTIHAAVKQELMSREYAVEDDVVFNEGFFALDIMSSVSGHALEKILEGLGQYVHFGLRARNVSWIVPVVSATTEDRSNASTIRPRSLFEIFVRELTSALGVPVVEIPMKRTVLVRQFYAAYSTWGYNSLCWRAPALRLLHPLAIAQYPHTEGAQRRIAFLKLTGRYGVAPERAFLRSDAFEQLLIAQHVTVLDPTLPLLHRMRLVNEAELIVTTWGSTTTTTLWLLLDRRGDGARPLTIVVLVHPGYLLEARLVFWMRAKRFRSKKKRVTEVRHNLSVKRGAFWGYDGGPRFCCRFVYIHTLDEIDGADLRDGCSEIPPSAA